MLVENINFTKVAYMEEAHFCSFLGEGDKKEIAKRWDILE
jgi:hypothetical protein